MAKKNGRPTKYNSAVGDMIVMLTEKGHYLETAACSVGIDVSTLRSWVRMGKRGHPGYKAFADAVVKAQAQAEINDYNQLVEVGATQWQSIAWRMERRNHKHWGQKKPDAEAPKEKQEPPPIADVEADLLAKLAALKASGNNASGQTP